MFFLTPRGENDVKWGIEDRPGGMRVAIEYCGRKKQLHQSRVLKIPI